MILIYSLVKQIFIQLSFFFFLYSLFISSYAVCFIETLFYGCPYLLLQILQLTIYSHLRHKGLIFDQIKHLKQGYSELPGVKFSLHITPNGHEQIYFDVLSAELPVSSEI